MGAITPTTAQKLMMMMGGGISLSNVAYSTNGPPATIITVTGTTNGQPIVFGVEFSINAVPGAYPFSFSGPGAAVNQSIGIVMADWGIVAGDTVYIRAYTNSDPLDGVGTRVYGTPTLTVVLPASGTVILLTGNTNQILNAAITDQAGHTVTQVGIALWVAVPAPPSAATTWPQYSSGNRNTLADSADWALAAKEFFLEIAFEADSTSANYSLFDIGRANVGDRSLQVRWNVIVNSLPEVSLSSNGNTWDIKTDWAPGSALSANTNYIFALGRKNGNGTAGADTFYYFINGTLRQTFEVTHGTALFDSTAGVDIGGDAGLAFAGEMIVRLTVDNCLYTATYTPAALPFSYP